MAQRLGLTARERRKLAQALVQCQEARHYRRLLALQELDRGQPVAAVAKSLEVSRQSVHTWIQTYRRTRSFEALAAPFRAAFALGGCTARRAGGVAGALSPGLWIPGDGVDGALAPGAAAPCLRTEHG
jgi:hypothetical protein